jgi:hypothetical protein
MGQLQVSIAKSPGLPGNLSKETFSREELWNREKTVLSALLSCVPTFSVKRHKYQRDLSLLFGTFLSSVLSSRAIKSELTQF